jgi:KaiC/GvpD/RAD55 family RecA-like ATPase
VPDEIAKLTGWLMWRYEHHDGEDKPRKVPYYTNGLRRSGINGNPTERNNLTTLEAAKSAAARQGFDGVGFCPMPEWGYTLLDFDHCVTADGVLPDVLSLVSDTYAEFSPSGEGVRAVVKGYLGDDKYHAKDGGYGFETFSTKGYCTFTGNVLPVCELMGNDDLIAPITDTLRAVHFKFFGMGRSAENFDPFTNYMPALGLSVTQISEALDVLDPDMDRREWIQVGMGIHHETAGSIEGFNLWDKWSQGDGCTKYPGSRALMGQWKSFGDKGSEQVTARTLIKMANQNGASIRIREVASVEDVQKSPTPVDPESLRFKHTGLSQFANLPPPRYHVKGLLPEGSLAIMYGASGSGKSFVAIDLCMHIVMGKAWRTLRVREGRVAYIAAEGAGGIRKRIKAYAVQYGLDLAEFDDKFRIIDAAPNFLERDDIVDVVKSLRTIGKVDVVVIDTFAQVTPGANENAGEDMGKALYNINVIHRATGATPLMIHHSGKDASKGARGWSGLRAACDSEIEISRLDTGRLIRSTKQKDGEDNLEWGFELSTVNIGIDEDGDVVTSCVPIEIAIPQGSSGPQKRMGKWEKAILDVFREFSLVQNTGIEETEVVKEVLRRDGDFSGGGKDRRREHVRRAMKLLVEGENAPFFIEDGCLTALF